MAKKRQDNSELPQNYNMISTKKLKRYFKYHRLLYRAILAKNRSPYDIDQKTESYFKYTQKSATILAKLRQENSKIVQN